MVRFEVPDISKCLHLGGHRRPYHFLRQLGVRGPELMGLCDNVCTATTLSMERRFLWHNRLPSMLYDSMIDIMQLYLLQSLVSSGRSLCNTDNILYRSIMQPWNTNDNKQLDTTNYFIYRIVISHCRLPYTSVRNLSCRSNFNKIIKTTTNTDS